MKLSNPPASRARCRGGGQRVSNNPTYHPERISWTQTRYRGDHRGILERKWTSVSLGWWIHSPWSETRYPLHASHTSFEWLALRSPWDRRYQGPRLTGTLLAQDRHHDRTVLSKLRTLWNRSPAPTARTSHPSTYANARLPIPERRLRRGRRIEIPYYRKPGLLCIARVTLHKK